MTKHSLRTRYMKVINDNSVKGIDNGQDNQSHIFYRISIPKSIEGWRLNWTSGIMNDMVDAKAELFNGKPLPCQYSFFLTIR